MAINPQAYFENQRKKEVPEWLQRMDFGFAMDGLRVLDLGCGHGALAVDLAERGAAEVVGVDLIPERIEFATQHVAEAFPELSQRIRYLCQDVADLDLDGYFDLIVSKDCFEHIDNIDEVVGQLHRLLKPGGILAPGFSPLYYSPFGDHRRFRLLLPWLHAVLPMPWLLQSLRKRTGRDVYSCSDINLNCMTPREFRRIFADSTAWQKVDIRYNRGNKLMLPLFRLFRRLPMLEKYFTISIYALAQKAA